MADKPEVRLVLLMFTLVMYSKAYSGPGGRVVHFPKDRSLGSLSVPYVGEDKPVYPDAYGTEEYVGEAKGDVVVEGGKELHLTVGSRQFENIPLLSVLGPNDLDCLAIFGFDEQVKNPDETVMPHLGGLTGLKELKLSNIWPSGKGLQCIRSMKSLKRLHFGSLRLRSSGMVHLGELESLEELNLGLPNVTDAGLKHLGKLTRLRKLHLGAKRVRGPGLAYLSGLRSLESLSIICAGENSERAMRHLKDITSLRSLDMAYGPPITDKGLEYLSQLPNLEEVSVDGRLITDEGWGHLRSMRNLKKLSIGTREITDDILFRLKDNRSLESLENLNLSQRGMEYLSQMRNLKSVSFAYRCKITDATCEWLSRLELLEEIVIRRSNVTDEGMKHLGKLTRLKILRFVGPITNEGLSDLTGLKSLQWLWLHETKITKGGLKYLNKIPLLARLWAEPVADDNSVLDLRGLTRLESLHLDKSALGDEDLVCLSRLTHLKQLLLYSGDKNRIGNAGIAHVAKLKSLAWLHIRAGAGLGDEGLAHIGKLKKLQFMNIITDGNFTDKGLLHLEGLKGLHQLTIHPDDNFSDGALERLWGALPHVSFGNVAAVRDTKRPSDKK